MTATTTAKERKAERPIWSWHFDSDEDLRTALEEYPPDESSVRILRDKTEGGQDPCPLSEPEDCRDCPQAPECKVELHAAQRRSEIDACMDLLQYSYPFYWRLLDLYYRCGANAEVKGWIIVAKRFGLRGARCPHQVRCTMTSQADEPEDNRRELPSCRAMIALACNADRKTFRGQLEEGVKRLYRVHEGRRR